ncbi:MAG: hypothetical protein AAF790_00135, partial [Planctomycetota bacterium]
RQATHREPPMRTEQFFQHHGIEANPFAEEDAQTDPVFKNRCRENTYHPAWDKVFGDLSDPATSIVFGEKGAGKTAMRLQITSRIAEHNRDHKQDRLWVIEYDDFNPLLDCFADRLPVRKQRDPARVLAEWKLWDHMDALLSLGVTDLIDHLLDARQRTGPPANRLLPSATESEPSLALDHAQKRDLLLLAACYDDSSAAPLTSRWKNLRRRLRFGTLGLGNPKRWLEAGLGLGVTTAAASLMGYLAAWGWLQGPWLYAVLTLAWLPWLWKWLRFRLKARGVRTQVRVLRRETATTQRLLMALAGADLQNQPLPNKRRTDDRYELLQKFQGVLRSLGVTGILVLVDRVDEPHLTGGKVELMRDLVWSMLDNKFLKQPGIGVKLLLPDELMEHLNRETREFHQRARIDKQNLVPSLDWTGEALLDLANARLAACATGGATPTLRGLLAEDIREDRLIDAMRSLRTPRHLFKFLYRLIAAHCNAYTDTSPEWRVSRDLFEQALALYSRDQASVDRGLSAG